MASATPLELQVDLTVFGDSAVIETRGPRSVFGRLDVGDDVTVVDDDVARAFRVVALNNSGRDVRLCAVGPYSVDATTAANMAAADFGK